MIEDDIATLVEAHYETPDAPVLMLSSIGVQLSEAGKWPLAGGDKRSLIDIVEAMPQIVVVRDPSAKSFIAIVRPGEEALAQHAIALRESRSFIRGLPRAVILAFTLEIAVGQQMYLRLEPRPTYTGSPHSPGDGFIIVDDDLRIPGLIIESLGSLDADTAKALEAKVRLWCDRHGVQTELLRRRERRSDEAAKPVPKASSALERLYAAQSRELADRLIIPIDIAMTLSKMP